MAAAVASRKTLFSMPNEVHRLVVEELVNPTHDLSVQDLSSLRRACKHADHRDINSNISDVLTTTLNHRPSGGHHQDNSRKQIRKNISSKKRSSDNESPRNLLATFSNSASRLYSVIRALVGTKDGTAETLFSIRQTCKTALRLLDSFWWKHFRIADVSRCDEYVLEDLCSHVNSFGRAGQDRSALYTSCIASFEILTLFNPAAVVVDSYVTQ